MQFDPETSAFLTVVILTLMGAAWLAMVVPRCDHPECANAHASARVKRMSAAIEKTHATFHEPTKPQPNCPLCWDAKRRDEPPE